MFTAVHSDRSGRLVQATDYVAAASNGLTDREITSAIPLPDDAIVVPLLDRVAIGIDRSGKPRQLGAARLAAAAILPLGYVRIALPSYGASARATALDPRPYAAIAADESGAIVVSAVAIDEDAAAPDRRADPAVRLAMSAGLRAQPANRVVRQLARCARDYSCRAAVNAFLRVADGAVPVGAPSNEHSADGVLVNARPDAAPTDAAAFHPAAEEVAEAAAAHLSSGGATVAFGRACEGEPLLVARILEAAIAEVRTRTDRGTIHLETNGSVPSAIARLALAGLDTVAVRIASARSDTYERLHRPSGYRFTDVRASVAEAVRAKIGVALILLTMPGLTDTPREIDAVIALAGELPAGSELLLRDLAADPARVRALVDTDEQPIGMLAALERLRTEVSHIRVGTHARVMSGV